MATVVDNILSAHLVKDLTNEALENVKKRIIENMGVFNRNASGRSVASLRVQTSVDGGNLSGLASFMAMETGRKQGKIPAGFRQIITDWIIAKGISIYMPKSYHGTDPLRNAAFLIARKIKTSGTTLHRSGYRQDIFTRAAQEETQKLSQKLLFNVSSGIDYLHKDFAKLNR